MTSGSSYEKLIRVRAERRGAIVELRVHYSVSSQKGGRCYQIRRVEDVERFRLGGIGTSTNGKNSGPSN